MSLRIAELHSEINNLVLDGCDRPTATLIAVAGFCEDVAERCGCTIEQVLDYAGVLIDAQEADDRLLDWLRGQMVEPVL